MPGEGLPEARTISRLRAVFPVRVVQLPRIRRHFKHRCWRQACLVPEGERKTDMPASPLVRLKESRRNPPSREQVIERIRAEFRDLPCLRLTRGQAQRLFGLRADVCERVFQALVDEGLLTLGDDARYGVRPR
jgi:hypothetical protein